MNLDTLSPEEALKLFKQADLKSLELIQILQGLDGRHVEEALKFLEKNPGYNRIVQHYARGVRGAMLAVQGLDVIYDTETFARALESMDVPPHCQTFYKAKILNRNAAMWAMAHVFGDEPILLDRFLMAYQRCFKVALAS